MNIMPPYVFSEIGKVKENGTEATLHLAILEKLRHPMTKDHLAVCLVSTQTAQLQKNIGHVEELDKILRCVSKDVCANIIVAPEYSYYPGERPLTKKEKNYFLTLQKQYSKDKLLIPGTFVWEDNGFMYNEAYFLSNGEVAGRHLKIRDGGEMYEAKKFGLQYSQGTKSGLLEWNLLKIGIEICMDIGTLAANGIEDRDLLFAVSCGRQDIDTSSLRNGGYGFVNDGLLEHVFISYRGF